MKLDHEREERSPMKEEVTFTKEIAGAELEVTLDTETGYFQAEVNGTTERTRTLDDLVKFARRRIRTKKIDADIPFTFVMGDGVRHGRARGINDRTGDYLITWEDNGHKSTLDSIQAIRRTFRRLSEEESKTLLDYVRRLKALGREVDDYKAPLMIDLRSKIREALSAKVEEEEEISSSAL